MVMHQAPAALHTISSSPEHHSDGYRIAGHDQRHARSSTRNQHQDSADVQGGVHVYGASFMIYIGFVNWFLMLAVLFIMFQFRESSRLAAAYGLAVTGTMTLTGVMMTWIRLEAPALESVDCVLCDLGRYGVPAGKQQQNTPRRLLVSGNREYAVRPHSPVHVGSESASPPDAPAHDGRLY
jgi:hypothetical protein